MRFDEALSLAEDELRVWFREEEARLSLEIEAMKRDYAARGMFKSGATLKKARDFCIESERKRVDAILATFTRFLTPVGSVKSTDIETTITGANNLLNKPDQIQHITKIASLAEANDLLDRLVSAFEDAKRDQRQRLEANLRLLVGGHQPSTRSSRPFLDAVELIFLLMSLLLAVLWIRNPTGEYEPWLVLMATVAALVSIVHKVRRHG